MFYFRAVGSIKITCSEPTDAVVASHSITSGSFGAGRGKVIGTLLRQVSSRREAHARVVQEVRSSSRRWSDCQVACRRHFLHMFALTPITSGVKRRRKDTWWPIALSLKTDGWGWG